MTTTRRACCVVGMLACLSAGLLPRAHATATTMPPTLRGLAHVADGTDAKPYQAIVKDCAPFTTWDDNTKSFSGYHIDQMNTLHSTTSPFRLNYTLSNTTYDETLAALA